MFVLFHSVPYEGESFLGVFSTLERAQEAGLYHIRELTECDIFIGRVEVYPVEPDAGFRVVFGQQPVWTCKSI